MRIAVPMLYIDGFVIPVPNPNIKAYVQMAQKAGKIWREHGFAVSPLDEARSGRDRGVLVDRLQVTISS